MPWQIAIFFHVLLGSFRSIQNRRIGLFKQDVSLYALVASFTSVFIVGIVIAISRSSFLNHQDAWDARYFLIIGGMLFGTLNLLSIKLFRLLPASVVVLISLLNTVSAVLVAVVFAGESLKTTQWVGGLFIMASIAMVALIANGKSIQKKQVGLVLTLFISISIAAMFGPAIINEKYLINRIGLETYLLYGWGMQALSAFLIALTLRKSHLPRRYSIKIHLNVWMYGLILAFSGVFFVLSLVDSNSASVASIGASAKVVLTVFMAYFILKEKTHIATKAISIVLSSIGLFLLFM